jgi:hypothetical protein
MQWYKTEDYFLLLFPDEDTASRAAAAAAAAAAATVVAAAAWTAAAVVAVEYWSNFFRKPVNYIDLNSPFMILELPQTIPQVKVLYKDKVGWINFYRWENLSRLQKD